MRPKLKIYCPNWATGKSESENKSHGSNNGHNHGYSPNGDREETIRANIVDE